LVSAHQPQPASDEGGAGPGLRLDVPPYSHQLEASGASARRCGLLQSRMGPVGLKIEVEDSTAFCASRVRPAEGARKSIQRCVNPFRSCQLQKPAFRQSQAAVDAVIDNDSVG